MRSADLLPFMCVLGDVCYLRASSMALFTMFSSKTPTKIAAAPSLRNTTVVGVALTPYTWPTFLDVVLLSMLKFTNVTFVPLYCFLRSVIIGRVCSHAGQLFCVMNRMTDPFFIKSLTALGGVI